MINKLINQTYIEYVSTITFLGTGRKGCNIKLKRKQYLNV